MRETEASHLSLESSYHCCATAVFRGFIAPLLPLALDSELLLKFSGVG